MAKTIATKPVVSRKPKPSANCILEVDQVAPHLCAASGVDGRGTRWFFSVAEAQAREFEDLAKGSFRVWALVTPDRILGPA